MGSEWSGKRTLAETTAEIPIEIGDTEEAVGLYVNAVAHGVATGGLDPRVADTLKDLARTKLSAIRQKAERQKVDDLWEILRRAEALAAEGISYAEACRQHREDPLLGRWRVDTVKGKEVWTNDANGDPERIGEGKKVTPG